MEITGEFQQRKGYALVRLIQRRRARALSKSGGKLIWPEVE